MEKFYRCLEIAKNPARHKEFRTNKGGKIYVEVTPDVFEDIMAGDPGKSCDYGPMRVYKVGTVSAIDAEESMTTNQKLHGSVA